MAAYPRPDFERSALRWQSLNGPWDFIFDDEDVVTLSGSDSSDGASAEADSIMRGIVGEAGTLIKENILSRSKGTKNEKRKIEVPYVFQSPASGINDRGVHEVLWYERSITDLRTEEEKKAGHRVLARFGAVDYLAKVWVNGQFLGEHRGGHVPFDLDITDALDTGAPQEGAHRLTLRVYDSAYDLTQPRGKQYWNAKPESIFYTPSGGIWQNVWLEVVPAARLADSSGGTVIRSNGIESGKLFSKVAVVGRRAAQKLSVQMEASFAGVSVAKSEAVALPKEKDVAEIQLNMKLSEQQRKALPVAALDSAPLSDDNCWRDGVALWSPEHPQLYDLTIHLLDSAGKTIDEVKTFTGMRSLNWTSGDGTWRLNGKPYFQALCLDQGYWPETFMTPPSADALRTDIELAKAMGFNGCRKHQKVEDPAFYYWANKLGYLVWAEMANAYQFSPEYVERFDHEWVESMKLAINHPSVVTWTPVNESWGYTSLKDNMEQRNHIRSLYYVTKTLDPTRSINDNCGWEHVLTDLTTYHDYSDGPELAKTSASLQLITDKKAGRDMFLERLTKEEPEIAHRRGAPVMCTEFGGVNIAPPAAASASSGADGGAAEWGYTTAKDAGDLLQRFEKLIHAVTRGGYCCAFVYTQLTDIEQETNGLYSFNREAKMDPAKVKAVIDGAMQEYYKATPKTA
ncbi:glycosyl hydrolases family 2, sugar binding domain-containing protein [Sarocladium implicatum]|nr:glycosyl hydrolases family 2, sugar binding domain-containing protein [Sarocladium implicatum]